MTTSNGRLSCELCGGPASKLCTRCASVQQYVVYCSSECQQKDWKRGHKTVCGAAKTPIGVFNRVSLESSSYKPISPPLGDDPLKPFTIGSERITILPHNLNDPDGYTVCMLTEEVEDYVTSAPNFPQPVNSPVGLYRPANLPGNRGVGMFATREIKAGECIMKERPLLIASPVLKYPPGLGGATYEERASADLDHAERCLEIMLRRMTPEKRDAYLSLPNTHTEDGSGPLFGIFRTIANEVPQFTNLDTMPPTIYTGVCGILPQFNHSCSPNCYWSFETESLSFTLYAARTIKKDEEITLRFCEISDPYPKRTQELSKYGIKCYCQACQDPRFSEPRRQLAMNSTSPTTVNRWILDESAPDDLILKPCLERIQIIHEDGLESYPGYVWTLVEVCLCYIALGQAEEAQKYREMMIVQLPRWPDPSKINNYWLIEFIRSFPDLTKHPWWRSRFTRDLGM